MKFKTKIGIALAALFIFVSCKKENNAPVVPEIESISFQREGSSAYWTIAFQDGDGDIGVRKNPSSPDNDVLKLFLFGRKNSNWQADTSYGYSIDYIENVNPNRPLKGQLIIDISGLDFIEFKYNAFYYEAVLIDRAGHWSNRIKSPVLEFN